MNRTTKMVRENAESGTTLTGDIRKMMVAWDKIKAAAVAQHPGATDEQIYALTGGAMKYALGMR